MQAIDNINFKGPDLELIHIELKLAWAQLHSSPVRIFVTNVSDKTSKTTPGSGVRLVDEIREVLFPDLSEKFPPAGLVDSQAVVWSVALMETLFVAPFSDNVDIIADFGLLMDFIDADCGKVRIS